MDSYKELYLHMVHETDQAMRILEAAHRACEEAILNQDQPEIFLLPKENSAQENNSAT